MKDAFNREIEYLRISVTDRCNLRCRYCMPKEGVPHKEHSEILSYEDMISIARVCSSIGIDRIRLTGGEPLIRKNIIDFIYKLRRVEGIKEVNLTTNGLLLEQYAEKLKDAGVSSVNISLDSLKTERYKEITRGGNLEQVLKGINKALEIGFDKIKINTVVIKGFNDDEIDDFIELVKINPIYVRFIELMPIGEAEKLKIGYTPLSEIKRKLPQLKEVSNIYKTGPANYYSIDGYKGFIGFIDSISQCFCEKCNRIRLTADGKLLPCLHSSSEVDLKTILKNGNIDELRDAVRQVIELKPKSHNINDNNYIVSDNQRYMSQVGG